jgi:hypothetical protein
MSLRVKRVVETHAISKSFCTIVLVEKDRWNLTGNDLFRTLVPSILYLVFLTFIYFHSFFYIFPIHVISTFSSLILHVPASINCLVAAELVKRTFYRIILLLRTFISHVRFQVLTAASMKFRIVFWDVLPCKIVVDNNFTRQYIPEDNSELQNL